jgi:hypothetical protein
LSVAVVGWWVGAGWVGGGMGAGRGELPDTTERGVAACESSASADTGALHLMQGAWFAIPKPKATRRQCSVREGGGGAPTRTYQCKRMLGGGLR